MFPDLNKTLNAIRVVEGLQFRYYNLKYHSPHQVKLEPGLTQLDVALADLKKNISLMSNAAGMGVKLDKLMVDDAKKGKKNTFDKMKKLVLDAAEPLLDTYMREAQQQMQGQTREAFDAEAKDLKALEEAQVEIKRLADIRIQGLRKEQEAMWEKRRNRSVFDNLEQMYTSRKRARIDATEQPESDWAVPPPFIFIFKR